VTPTIALLTDFGLRDNYVGVMKGVMLSICPDARFVDISHEIPPGDVSSAAFLLEKSIDYFPGNTTFLVVADPRVGSERRALALRVGEQCFIGPDNGVFSRVLERSGEGVGSVQLVALTPSPYRLPRVSNTFHGRDIFAPATAHLAAGVPLSELGDPVSDPVMLPPPLLRVSEDRIEGEIVYVDRFGNLVTSVSGNDVDRLAGRGPGNIIVTVGGKQGGILAKSYAAVPPGNPVCVIGGFDLLEISVNGGSAADRFGAGIGTGIVLDAGTVKKTLGS